MFSHLAIYYPVEGTLPRRIIPVSPRLFKEALYAFWLLAKVVDWRRDVSIEVLITLHYDPRDWPIRVCELLSEGIPLSITYRCFIRKGLVDNTLSKRVIFVLYSLKTKLLTESIRRARVNPTISAVCPTT